MNKTYMIFDPFDGSNAYIENMKKCWEYFYKVIAPEQVERNFFLLLNTKAAVLNWTESKLDRETRKRLLWYKVLGIQIIWVYHNRMPHRIVVNPMQIEDAKRDMAFMAKISDVIILHSQNSRKYLMEFTHTEKKVFYVPHVDYENQYRWAKEIPVASNRPFRFVFQGVLSPYKNIELLIQAFNELKLPNCQLYIAGKPFDEEYGKKISRLCEDGNILLKLKFLSNREVGEVIREGDVVVLPYDLRSSMNSGAMLTSFSNKRTVIVSNNAMAQDYSKERFLYVYDYSDTKSHMKNLKKVMKEAYDNGVAVNREKGLKAYEYTRAHNAEAVVVGYLQRIVDFNH